MVFNGWVVFHLTVCHNLFDPFIVLKARIGSQCVYTQGLDYLARWHGLCFSWRYWVGKYLWNRPQLFIWLWKWSKRIPGSPSTLYFRSGAVGGQCHHSALWVPVLLGSVKGKDGTLLKNGDFHTALFLLWWERGTRYLGVQAHGGEKWGTAWSLRWRYVLPGEAFWTVTVLNALFSICHSSVPTEGTEEGSGVVQVTTQRLQRTSPPLGGHFRIQLSNTVIPGKGAVEGHFQTSNIPWDCQAGWPS